MLQSEVDALWTAAVNADDPTHIEAGELADLRDQAQLSGDAELVAEPLDRALVGERGLCTRTAHSALVAHL